MNPPQAMRPCQNIAVAEKTPTQHGLRGIDGSAATGGSHRGAQET
jgi:hypothetical protein